METYFLSGGVSPTAAMLNKVIAAGKSFGVLDPTSFSVAGDKLQVAAHSCLFKNGTCVFSNGDEYKLSSYFNVSSNSYQGTLVYKLDPSLYFEAVFSVVDGIVVQEDTEDCVLGWVLHPGNNASWSSAYFHAAPKIASTKWLDVLVDFGEVSGLTRTISGHRETYVNSGSTTQTVEIVRYIAVDEQPVRSLRFHGSLSDGVILDFYVMSEQAPWTLVGSLSGAQDDVKHRIPVFAFNQGNYEMTSVRYVFRVPALKSFTLNLLGATNEVSYNMKNF